MPFLTFDDDPIKTPHIVRNLDTSPPRAIIQLQHETGWGLKEIRDQIQKADFYAPILTSYLTVMVAGRPVTWEYLLDTPMSEWPWSIDATQAERDGAEQEAEGASAPDAEDPPQPSPPGSDPDDAAQAEEWPPPAA